MIKSDKQNYRKHSERNQQLINKSLSETGAGRSILIDNENEIIAGNGVFEQWGDKPIKIVETDGSELIVVKRTDLKTNDPKRKQLAIMDNSTSDSSDFDMELLRCDFADFELQDMGALPDWAKGMDENNMTDEDVDIDADFDPIGISSGQQRVVFIFDGPEEAESYLNNLNVPFKKMNMAWQVNMSTLSI